MKKTLEQMGRMKNRKLSRYSTELLLARNIMNIADFMHANIETLDQYFSDDDMAVKSRMSEDEMKNYSSVLAGNQRAVMEVVDAVDDESEDKSEFMRKVFHYVTGEKRTVKEKNEETGEETEHQEDVRTRVGISRTPIDTQYKDRCEYFFLGGKCSNIVFVPVNSGEYTFFQFAGNKIDQKKFKFKSFDNYASELNLNKEAWLFRSMSLEVELVMAYLEKHKCKGIDIDPNDVPMLLERFGITPAVMDDIPEYK